jgi:hypothetical protein
MDQAQLEKRRRNIERGVKLGLLALVGFIVSPFIFLAVKGLVGIGIAAAVGLAVVNFAPVVAMKFANWKLSAVKAEAARNPIETLQNEYADRGVALASFREAINNFSASVKDFHDKLAGFKEKFPQDAEKFEDQLSKMKRLLEVRRSKYKEAQEALAKFETEIHRADAIWQMGLEAAKMNAAAGMTDQDFMAKIKVETALDSVSKTMNVAFAELETSLIEEEAEQQAEDQARNRLAAAKKAEEIVRREKSL